MNAPTFAIKGERGTGTRFLRKVINYYFENNFENIQSTSYDADGYYGWKHGYVLDDELKRINEDEVIVCIINKDIYSWLLSIYEHRYELKQTKKPNRFKSILLNKIGMYNDFESFISPSNDLYDRYESWIASFYKKEGVYDRYTSLYDLRYKKYQSMFNDKINHKIYFKYEDLLKDHYTIVNALSQQYDLEICKDRNKNFDSYSKRDFYMNKEYMKSYSPQMIKTIEHNIDVAFEQKMGYEYY